ncbi:MAG: hypothetical protein RLZZ324_685 [Candidatus Parcubacteria bacterium]|jgi:uncharacterized protein YdeI (YjbR/CyaY-like superfamily)
MKPTPPDIRKAMAASAKVLALWNDLTPISRRDFISWIESAKQAETRKRRIAIAVSKLKSGQRRPCCYAVVPMNLYKALGAMPKAKAQWSALSSMEKRDLVDWIETAKEKEERQVRVGEVCVMLAAGKRKI